MKATRCIVVDLFTQVGTGDVKGSFDRSIKLPVLVTGDHAGVLVHGGMGFAAVSSATLRVLSDDRQPGGPGWCSARIGCCFQWSASMRAGTLGAGRSCHGRSVFGVLVMFAVMCASETYGRKRARARGQPLADRPVVVASGWRPVLSRRAVSGSQLFR